VKASLEKLLFMPLNPHKPTLMFQKKFLAGSSFGSFLSRKEQKNT